MTTHELVICNGISNWPLTQGFTCWSAKGHSVIDYLFISIKMLQTIADFQVTPLLLELDHHPLLVDLLFTHPLHKSHHVSICAKFHYSSYSQTTYKSTLQHNLLYSHGGHSTKMHILDQANMTISNSHMWLKNPKDFWHKLLHKPHTQASNNITNDAWLCYAKTMYESDDMYILHPSFYSSHTTFTTSQFERISKLSNCKDRDIEGIQELLQLGKAILVPYLVDLYNHFLKDGFPSTWAQSIILSLYKQGCQDEPSNY